MATGPLDKSKKGTIKMAKLTIKSKTLAALEELRGMDHRDLTGWAKGNGMDSAAGFSAFKKALLENGIDFDALRQEARGAQGAALAAQATASLTLFSDAKAKNDRFGICDKSGNPVWYGKFFDNDRDYNGEQSSGEMAAAKKAVWLASKVKEAIGAPALALTLKVDAEWLCWANAVRMGAKSDVGGKARPLGEMAQKLGVVLTVEHIPGTENPADKYTVCTGFLKYSETDIKTLVD